MSDARAPTRIILASGTLLLLACGAPEMKATVSSVTPQKPIEGELLLFPHADAESLLGRGVSSDGRTGYRIADERSPGCEVIVRRTKASFHAVRETTTSQLAAVGASLAQLIQLEAKYGRESLARLELDNTVVLEADLRGPCGAKVVTKVFVGRGKRRVFAAAQASGSGSLTTSFGSISPNGQSSAQEVDELAWGDDQAYAFDVREVPSAHEEPLAIDIQLPSIVVEGEELRVTFSSKRAAWLVVYYVDAENKSELLWPSNEEQAPTVNSGAPATLPSPREYASGIKIRPTLSRPGIVAREQFVVYAFADRRDFDLVKPPPGSTTTTSAFTDELTRRLRDVPASRWQKSVVGYQIQPAPAPQRR